MKRFIALGVLVLPASGVARAQVVGPASGSLVIVGGGLRDQAILERFIQLAGGTDAPIVVIPTAGEDDDYDAYWPGLGQLKAAGAKNLTVLHTRDPKVADTPAFTAPLTAARGVWFPGGRQWRLADAYLGTRTQADLTKVLERGGVIGGTSAGATILGSYLVRGDTRTNTIMIGDHEIGFGLVRNTAIDQHLLRRNRQFDLIGVIEKHTELLGIGLDENTAIVVRGDTFDVIGQSYVAIYDRHRLLGDDGRFYLLQPGDRFNLNTREPSRAAGAEQSLEGLRRQDWPKR
jgi:cyanophycinase